MSPESVAEQNVLGQYDSAAVPGLLPYIRCVCLHLEGSTVYLLWCTRLLIPAKGAHSTDWTQPQLLEQFEHKKGLQSFLLCPCNQDRVLSHQLDDLASVWCRQLTA